MSKLSYALGMLTLAGAGVTQAATTTTFNFTVPDFSTTGGTVVVGDLTPITLAGGSAPQFYFGSFYAPCSTGNGSCTAGSNGSSYTALSFLETAADVSQGHGPPVAANTYAGSPYEDSAFGTKTLTPGLPSVSEKFNYPPIVTTSKFVSPFSFDTGGGNFIDLNNVNLLAFAARQGTGALPDLYLHTLFAANNTYYLGTFDIKPTGNVQSITFAEQVPEPDAWALLIAGTAMVGGAMRSRRRKVALAA
jgi:hypothetical protein